jgi:hypothetical protein
VSHGSFSVREARAAKLDDCALDETASIPTINVTQL